MIGAGIGGLAAACALRERSFEVAVYERAGELANEVLQIYCWDRLGCEN